MRRQPLQLNGPVGAFYSGHQDEWQKNALGSRRGASMAAARSSRPPASISPVPRRPGSREAVPPLLLQLLPSRLAASQIMTDRCSVLPQMWQAQGCG
ncbi:hypothetical protein GCM10010289_85690 [Streptomyces violascens]|nr:hypothetical protein GCM10010289_85690 [Streptomyces violascens]